jgi:hypothetical protein
MNAADPGALAGGGRLRRRSDRRHNADRTCRHPCTQPNRRRADAPCRPQNRSAGDGIRRRRQASGQPVAANKGGWNVFFAMIDRSIPNIHPFGNPALRADGKAAYDGWPDSPRIEELRRAWLDSCDPAEQHRIATELQMQVWQDVPFIPMGEYWQTRAYRKGLRGSSRAASRCFITSSAHRRSSLALSAITPRCAVMLWAALVAGVLPPHGASPAGGVCARSASRCCLSRTSALAPKRRGSAETRPCAAAVRLPGRPEAAPPASTPRISHDAHSRRQGALVRRDDELTHKNRENA